MTDILTTIQGLLGGELASKAAAQLGESEGGVQRTVGALVPLVLGSLISRTETPGGAQAALNLSQQAYNTTGSHLTSTSGLLNLLGGNSTLDGSWPSTLFGSTVGPGAIASALGRYAGVSPASASSLLGLVGPAVLGLLGQQAVNNNLNANGFASLLAGLKGPAQAMLPAGLSSLTGLLGLGATAGSAPGTPSSPGLRPSVPTPAPPAPPAGGPRWPLLLLVVAAIAVLLYLLRGCDARQQAPATRPAPADTTRAAAPGPATATPLDTAAAAIKAGWAKLGALEDLKLPDGTVLRVPANGVEKRLVAFLADKGRAVDKTTWFSLDRLLFKTASSTLLPDSQEQLRNVAAILRAYPAAKLKLGGYTDNRGNAALNKKLSAERAQAVLAELTTGGVAANRLAAEGYGAEHPIAPNDTPAGRQQNRRVDVRVTAK